MFLLIASLCQIVHLSLVVGRGGKSGPKSDGEKDRGGTSDEGAEKARNKKAQEMAEWASVWIFCEVFNVAVFNVTLNRAPGPICTQLPIMTH